MPPNSEVMPPLKTEENRETDEHAVKPQVEITGYRKIDEAITEFFDKKMSAANEQAVNLTVAPDADSEGTLVITSVFKNSIRQDVERLLRSAELIENDKESKDRLIALANQLLAIQLLSKEITRITKALRDSGLSEKDILELLTKSLDNATPREITPDTTAQVQLGIFYTELSDKLKNLKEQ